MRHNRRTRARRTRATDVISTDHAARLVPDEQRLCLVLVDDEVVDERPVERSGRGSREQGGRIEEGHDPCCPRVSKRRRRHGERNFVLEDDVRIPVRVGKGEDDSQIGHGGRRPVRTVQDHNRVAPCRIDLDERAPSRQLHRSVGFGRGEEAHLRVHIHKLERQIPAEHFQQPAPVLPNPAREMHGGPRTSAGNGTVGALAAQPSSIARRGDGLARWHDPGPSVASRVESRWPTAARQRTLARQRHREERAAPSTLIEPRNRTDMAGAKK